MGCVKKRNCDQTMNPLEIFPKDFGVAEALWKNFRDSERCWNYVAHTEELSQHTAYISLLNLETSAENEIYERIRNLHRIAFP